MATNISGGVTTPTSTTHTGNGTTGPFSISFEYATRDDVQVFVGGVLKTVTTHYTFTSSTQITFTSGNAPTNGAIILIQRNTIVASPSHTFADASVLTATDLNQSNTQVLHGIQELVDDYVKRDGSQTIKSNLVFEGSTDDNNETTLAITNPTADRTITLPDTTGTVVTTGDTGSVSSTMITDGTIVDADINASAAISGSKLQAASGSNAGSMSASDKSKLDGIEANATADQTAAEIRTLVESATDSNVFTDADHTKLNAIEASATADQTAAEIRTLVESATDSNVFTDADHSKLNAIEAGATGDQTGAEIKSLYEGESDTNAFTDSEKTKLAGIEALATADQSNAEIKTAYEANSDTNAFTDAEKTKLGNLGSLNALSDVNTSGVADGKILKYNASASEFIIADDGGSGSGGASAFTGLSDTPANFGGAASKTVKVNAAGNALEFVTVTTPNTDLDQDSSPQLAANLDVQTNEITTSTTNGNVKLNPNGTGVVEIRGASGNDGTLQLNCSAQSHGIKLKSPAHSAGQSYTFVFPDNQIAADKYLKIKSISGSGSTAIGQAEYASLDANDLGEGTIPDARFPATLPALNGSALTNLNGSNIASGTVAAARIPTLNQDTTGTAAIATTVTVAVESSDTSCNVLFATAATGNLAPKSGTNLTFNSSSGVLTATGFAGALTGNVTGNASGSSGSCTGNAATATALETARTIAGVSFDGTANITLNNNAITNGAGYTTYTSNQATDTTSNVSFGTIACTSLTATGDVTAFSDQTLKKDIATINNALDLCGKLRGVSYKWIKDDKPSIGVIAQEVEAHIPEIVTTTQLDGADIKSVDYGKIVGVLINAVNELKAELDEYKGLYEKKNFLLADNKKGTFLVKKITDETAPDGVS